MFTNRGIILKDTVPNLSRVGFLLARVGIADDLQFKELRPAAQLLKLKLEAMETQADATSLERTFANRKAKAGGRIYDAAQSSVFRRTQTNRRACGEISLTVPPDGMFLAYDKRIIALAAKHRIPTLYGVTELAEAGGLMGLWNKSPRSVSAWRDLR